MTSFSLTSAEIASMRADLEDTVLPDTCDILSVTRTSDGQGGWTDAWATATEDVACRIDFRGGVESIAGAAVQPFSGYVLTVPHDTTLTTAHRIYHGTIYYNVIEVDNSHSWQLFLRARLEKV